MRFSVFKYMFCSSFIRSDHLFYTPTLFHSFMRLILQQQQHRKNRFWKFKIKYYVRDILNVNMRQMFLMGNHTFDVIITIKCSNQINTTQKETSICHTPYYYYDCVALDFFALDGIYLEFICIQKCCSTHIFMGVCVWVHVCV